MAETIKQPLWLRRALDPSTPTTKANETVKTMSMDGKLFPTVRMINGKLTKLEAKEAYDMAIEKRDYIQFNSDEEATKFSKDLSRMIGEVRNGKRSIIGQAVR